jgi:hypothetical protein
VLLLFLKLCSLGYIRQNDGNVRFSYCRGKVPPISLFVPGDPADLSLTGLSTMDLQRRAPKIDFVDVKSRIGFVPYSREITVYPVFDTELEGVSSAANDLAIYFGFLGITIGAFLGVIIGHPWTEVESSVKLMSIVLASGAASAFFAIKSLMCWMSQKKKVIQIKARAIARRERALAKRATKPSEGNRVAGPALGRKGGKLSQSKTRQCKTDTP